MQYTVIVKAIVGIPTIVEAGSVSDALVQAGAQQLDTSQAFLIRFTDPATWLVREEVTHAALTSLTTAVRALLDLLQGAGGHIYDEPAILLAVSALQEAEVAEETYRLTSRVQNEEAASNDRSRDSQDFDEVR